MQYEEISRIVRVAAAEGIREVRVTGGEPLVRKDLPDLIKMLAGIPGIEDLSLTTNGIFLDTYAKTLAEAGLKRVNISLDTLRPDLFKRLTRGGNLSWVMNGLQAAEAAGLEPIKLNTVILKNINSDEIESLASLTLTHKWNVRFIELMPVQNQQPWGEGFPPPEEMYFRFRKLRAVC